MAEISRAEREEVARWEVFLETEKGFYPPKIAAAKLGLTVQGVRAASDRGWLRYFQIGTERFYSRRDVVNYEHNPRRKNAVTKYSPPHKGALKLE